MDTPLYDAIKEYNPSARFHMPGTSGETSISPLYLSANFDVTELDFSDNLLSATGVILESEKLTAKRYHSKHCLYFTSGATTALFTAILVAKDKVSSFYCLHTPHKSIINAFLLFGINYQIVDELPLNAGGIIVTTPDYYGKTISVKDIRRKHPEAFIIVDEAHGAHFPYSSLLPINVGAEADIVINGLHKTLPVFTGGAILRTEVEEYYQEAKEYRSKIHTTSPSYLTMCSMDYTQGYMTANGERLYKELKQKVDNLTLPQGFKKIPTDDFSRLVIEVPESTTGYAVSKAANKKGIYFELVESRLLVAILTPFNMDKLPLLEQLDSNPKAIETEDLSKYIGTVAKQDIGLYPPGKVYIKKGEIIDAERIEMLQIEAERVFGLK